MNIIIENQSIILIESDVSFGPRTSIICDSHDLPFANNYFDGVIIQAVLEHVIDPIRCVQEIYRVLKNDGIIYAETPFMQQVHMGRFDFTRFTELGHRRLFRFFSETDRGPIEGPGSALAWSLRYFVLSFATNSTLRVILKIITNFLFFYLKYFDIFLNKKPGAYDAASGYFFIGRKLSRPINDKEIISTYKGCV